jgi:hypothetical protein
VQNRAFLALVSQAGLVKERDSALDRIQGNLFLEYKYALKFTITSSKYFFNRASMGYL